MLFKIKYFFIYVALAIISISSFGHTNKNPQANICFINHIQEILAADGSRNYISFRWNRVDGLDGERKLVSFGEFHCLTQASNKKVSLAVGIANTGNLQDRNSRIHPIYIRQYFPGYRNDDKHAYVEVYCNRAVYFYYEDNQWNSETASFNIPVGATCTDG